MRDDGAIVGRGDICAHRIGELPRIGFDQIRDRQKADRRVLRGQPRAQRADAAGADDRDAELLAFDDVLLRKSRTRADARFGEALLYRDSARRASRGSIVTAGARAA
jgi:hypothetical protein